MRFAVKTLFPLIIAGILLSTGTGLAAPDDVVDKSARCPVCGMFVAKYDVWITQLRLEDGQLLNFDGVKDLMAYYFNPAQFSDGPPKLITEIWVKDYYSLKWIDAFEAFYVAGSDVHGPMGHELVPFASRAAAEAFHADHHGDKVLSFAEITKGLIDRLRAGQKMK